LGIRKIDTISIASYDHGGTGEQTQGDLAILKTISSKILETKGEGVLIIDDLVDTGKTARRCVPCCRRRISPPSMPSRRAARWSIRL
jgi:hypoxanthine phosphoribosyltransferase